MQKIRRKFQCGSGAVPCFTRNMARINSFSVHTGRQCGAVSKSPRGTLPIYGAVRSSSSTARSPGRARRRSMCPGAARRAGSRFRALALELGDHRIEPGYGDADARARHKAAPVRRRAGRTCSMKRRTPPSSTMTRSLPALSTVPTGSAPTFPRRSAPPCRDRGCGNGNGRSGIRHAVPPSLGF